MESDRFEEAQEGESSPTPFEPSDCHWCMLTMIFLLALTKAGRRSEAVHLLEQLAMNAVSESR